MKFHAKVVDVIDRLVSPSTRREWIEIRLGRYAIQFALSPSTRREWIEIVYCPMCAVVLSVSLHTEGVD